MLKPLPMICLLLVAVSGCSDSNDNRETVFDDQIQSLEKARGVEQQLEQAAKQQRQSIEEQDQ